MTRINVGVHPSELPSKLLLAEHYEMIRIPNAIIAMRVNLSKPIPVDFTLGPGHVRFFYNKIKFLHHRYTEIQIECQCRDFIITHEDTSFKVVKEIYPELYNDYTPGPLDREIIIDRIESKGFTLL
mgnify:CR=1 FL=1